jgi:hypothetical protein
VTILIKRKTGGDVIRSGCFFNLAFCPDSATPAMLHALAKGLSFTPTRPVE